MSLRLFSTIHKITNPCIKCVNYIPYKYIDPYDELYDNDSETKIGTCYKFGNPNYVTGEIQYDNALQCRIWNNKCGKEGKYYTPKPNTK